MSDRIRLLIVDDSPLAREALRAILERDGVIEVIGMAKDGDEAVKKTITLKPDVITMDLNMPGMGGLEAIKTIMIAQPTPIIVVSGMSTDVVIMALSAGAMDFIVIEQDIEKIAGILLEKIKIASRIKPIHRIDIKPVKNKDITYNNRKAGDDRACKVIAIGVSTGGPQALQVLLSVLPADLAASIIIVQHMSPGFIDGFRDWLQEYCKLNIRVARTGDTLEKSAVYLAPDKYNIKVSDLSSIVLSEPITNMTHVPSIDIMMMSVAEVYREKAIGVIMTGMSRDGVEGIKAIKFAGGITIAQDEKSSAIFGMNKVAIDSGCVDKVLSLEDIAKELIRIV